MAVPISPTVIDTLLLGPASRRRQLQDFPVLADVWTLFAGTPGKSHDLLITPTWEKPSGRVAKILSEERRRTPDPDRPRRISYLQDLVAAELSLEDLARIVIPASSWWDKIEDSWLEERRRRQEERKAPPAERPEGPERVEDSPPGDFPELIRLQFEACSCEEPEFEAGSGQPEPDGADRLERLSTATRQAVKLGLLLGVLTSAAAAPSRPARGKKAESPLETMKAVRDKLDLGAIATEGAEAIRLVREAWGEFSSKGAASQEEWSGLIFTVSLNRAAAPAIAESVPAVKADAARQLFSIRCKDIKWAVLDSGIDSAHPAFIDHDEVAKQKARGSEFAPGEEPSRVKATYDFACIRSVLSLDHLDAPEEPGDLAKLLAVSSRLSPEDVQARLRSCSRDLDLERPPNWEKIEPLILQHKPRTPEHPHGTHVAGILGADWREGDHQRMIGVCPDITLYDFRVLGPTADESEFAVIAALQFIRYLNDRSGFSVIDGINMSLSIPHNVRNYACGRTPVCIEAEGLAANGVVVVAAAGNFGYQQFRLGDNTVFESYAASSITDPGNADAVITVGATHRHWPHTYGVSFFSSRGPTGDGRLKPDILAPGEKIESCVPGRRSDQMDGTSMAAPHVSGAAALLMARHQELRAQPAQIKKLLCDTATDLNRERSFQGHGMVDVLRAMQAV